MKKFILLSAVIFLATPQLVMADPWVDAIECNPGILKALCDKKCQKSPAHFKASTPESRCPVWGKNEKGADVEKEKGFCKCTH